MPEGVWWLEPVSVPVRTVLAMERIEVSTTAGIPVSFVRAGRTWHVGVPPVRWFERVAWWETAERMQRGEMSRVDIEVWRLQARIGHNPRTPLVTFELILGQDRATWLERSMDTIAA